MKAQIRSRLRRALCWLLYYSGLVALLRALDRRFARGRYRIIFFHHVVGDDDPLAAYLHAAGYITRPNFAALMAYLARHYSVVTLDDIAGNRPLPPNAVALTFDDGYADNAGQALPILQRHRLPAAFFPATGAIDTGCPLWYDTLSLILLETQATAVRASIGGHDLVFTLGALADRSAAAAAITYALKSMPDQDKDRIIARLAADLDVPQGRLARHNLMLTWAQVQTMSRMEGITIGAHTVSHPVLSRVSLPRAEEEIAASRAAIAQKIGRPVRFFSYPDGTAASFTPAIADLVRKAGFALAVSTIPGSNGPESNPFALRRIAVDPDPLYVIAVRLLFTRDVIYNLVRRLRRG
jgi:peptidoglycan/xylan/chitin deacetylase (PgdA/CDA1 family)